MIVGAADAACRVGDGVESARFVGYHATTGARSVWRGVRGLHREGRSTRAQVAARGTVIGGALYHTDDDKLRALDDLGAAIGALVREVRPIAEDVRAPAAMRQWWRVDVIPMLAEWSAFQEAQRRSWVTRLAVDWQAYQAWLMRIRLLRSDARTQGIPLESPEPGRLPETMLERGGAGRGSILETLWTAFKVILYSALTITGIASLMTARRGLPAKTATGSPT